jgi:hypothetical protein
VNDSIKNADENGVREDSPGFAAVALTFFVVLFSLAVIAIAIYELSHSRGWQLAPVILERALRQN